MKAFGDKLQILLQFKLRQHHGSTRFLVTFDHFGIGIDISAASEVAEEDVLHILVGFIRGIVGREEHGIGPHDHLVGLGSPVERSAVIVEIAVDTQHRLGRLGQIDVDVRADHIFLQVDIAVEIVFLGYIKDTVVLGDAPGNVVAGYCSAAADVEIQAVVHGVVLEQQVLPVGGRIHLGIGAGYGVVDLRGGVRQIPQRITGAHRFIVQVHIGDGIGQFYVLCWL